MSVMKKLALLGVTAVFTVVAAGAALAADPVDVADLKVGAIYIGDEQEGYTMAHMDGIAEMKEALGLSDDQVIEKFNIPEDESCYDAAVDLAEQGCQLIIANSFGHEDYLFQAASEYPDVQFCHATGYQAAGSDLENVHNYFTSIYEARYVSGVVAGMKLKELADAGEIADENKDEDGNVKIGYVGAFSYAEVISGYTAFYLGVKSVYPEVAMEVSYTGSWADQALEKETAQSLIDRGCILIGQHADTTGAAAACEAAGVWQVGYNVSMLDVAPNVSLTSSTNNWGPYYEYAANSVVAGDEIDVDWCKGHSEGSVDITELGQNVAEGTQEKVDEVWAALDDGSLHVFDTTTFTVGGEEMTTTATDDLADFYNGVEYIQDGYFAESTVASAPSFDTIIDGITELDQAF